MNSFQFFLIQAFTLLYARMLKEDFKLSPAKADEPTSTAKDTYFWWWNSTTAGNVKTGGEQDPITEITYEHEIKLYVIYSKSTQREDLTNILGRLQEAFNQRELVKQVRLLAAGSKQKIWNAYVRDVQIGDLDERDNVDSSRSGILSFLVSSGLKI